MRVILELFRILFIFGFLGSLFGAMIMQGYEILGVNTERFEWMGFIAILLLLFVLYRNKWQFSGWYKGKGREKLSPKTTNLVITGSVLLLVIVPILSILLK